MMSEDTSFFELNTKIIVSLSSEINVFIYSFVSKNSLSAITFDKYLLFLLSLTTFVNNSSLYFIELTSTPFDEKNSNS